MMATCPTCGCDLLASEGPGQAAPVHPGPGEVELLGVASGARPGPATVTGTVGRRGAPRLWLGAAAAVAALGFGAWAVAGVGPSVGRHSSPEPTAATTTPSSEATTSPTGGGQREVPTTASTGGTGDTRDRAERVGGSGPEPVLSRPVGWSLLYGSPFADSGPLHRLDLDTGADVAYTGVDGGPVLVSGDRLVLAQDVDTAGTDGTGILRVVPVADPALGGTPVPMSATLNVPPYGRPVLPGPPGMFWLYTDDGGTAAWRLLRLSDAALMDQVEVGGPTDAYPIPGSGPDVVSSAGGGVFRREESGRYDQITVGRPELVSGTDVLVSTCDTPTRCRRRWVDLDGGALADRPLPPEGVYWTYLLPGNDRYAVGRRQLSIYENRIVLFDLEGGRTIETAVNGLGGAAGTPDGRIIGVHTGNGIELYDTEQDRWFVVPHSAPAPLLLAFVPNA